MRFLRLLILSRMPKSQQHNDENRSWALVLPPRFSPILVCNAVKLIFHSGFKMPLNDLFLSFVPIFQQSNFFSSFAFDSLYLFSLVVVGDRLHSRSFLPNNIRVRKFGKKKLLKEINFQCPKSLNWERC